MIFGSRAWGWLRGVSFVLMMFTLIPVAQGDGITRDEMVLRARNWHDLYAIYKRLGRTADGVVAGAFTDKVSELLADQWSTVSDLQRIVRRDTAFRKFVLTNINEAVPRIGAVYRAP